MRKLTEFSKENIQDVRVEIDKALEVLEKFGLRARIGNITFNDAQLRTKLTIDVSSKPIERTPAIDNRTFFGLHKGETIRIQGKVLTLEGFKPRNTKYPFICGGYKLSREQVQKNLV